MPLIVVGISHQTAPLEVRERLAFAADECAARALALRGEPGVTEAVIVSTCNRTEVYAVTKPGSEAQVADWLRRQAGGEAEDRSHYYTQRGVDAVRHLFRVAGGLESLVLGEPQILRQLKDAWEGSRQAGGSGKLTDRLFQRAFAAGKAVRHSTGINDHPVSVAYIATLLAQQIFGDLGHKTVLMVGAGEMIDLCARHLRRHGVGKLVILNRSVARATELAVEFGGEGGGLDELGDRLATADIVVSCTASRTPVVTLDHAREATRRRHRAMFMVDLGVPRDIDPAVADLADVYLYTIDDLQQVADENLDERHRAAAEAVTTVESAVEEFMRWLHGTRAAEGLRRLRDAAELDGARLAERALHQIEAGADPAPALQQLANTLVHTILHVPSTRLREAAEAEHYDFLQAADWLFDAEAVAGRDDEAEEGS